MSPQSAVQSQTDRLIANASAYADHFDEGADVRAGIEKIKASPFIPRTDSVRGFVYEVESGALREVA